MSLAPFADIFVARVARHSDDLEHASTAITRAIQWASEEHQVDIINMSLKSDGDTANQPSLREAIRAVVHRRDDRILFFGAAGNAGANEPGIAFPACHENVIPIFGTTPNGRFDDDLNPRIDPDGPAIFGTLGFDVPCHGVENGGEVEYRSGTSFSCANAAGFAATLLQYVQVLQHSKQDEQGANSLDWFNRLKTKRGMTSLFREISDRTPDRKYYLWPVRFFGRPASDSEADIIRALRYR
ncbi:Hypothetical protein D9617_13g100810 [Elsinoe fawcettii]|nr:Hypothetical protein D9617_13g100810 [Elsinoe fawcettii]